MSGELLIAGTMLVDVIKTVATYPEEGRLTKIFSVEKQVGGLVPNTALDLAALDPDFRFSVFGKVGRDEYGDFLLGRLSSAGVDTSRVAKSDTEPTGFTDVMSVRGGQRTFFTMPGANATLSEDDFDLSGVSHLHLGYLLLLDTLDAPDAEYGCRAARLLARAKKQGIRTSVDVVSEASERYRTVVGPALPYIDVLIVNETEAAKIAGEEPDAHPTKESLRTVGEKLLSLGVREKVIVHCPEMGIIVDKSGDFFAVPSLDLPKEAIVGTTGAGDAFCAGSLYGMANGYDGERILRLASLMAAANLSRADAVSGMRPLAALAELETRYGRRKEVCL